MTYASSFKMSIENQQTIPSISPMTYAMKTTTPWGQSAFPTFNKYVRLPDARLAPARLRACSTSAQRSGSRHLWNQETKWTSAMSIAVIDEQYKPGSRTNTEEKQRCWDAIFWLSKFHFVQGSPCHPAELASSWATQLLYTLLSELKHAWKALHATSLSASSNVQERHHAINLSGVKVYERSTGGWGLDRRRLARVSLCSKVARTVRAGLLHKEQSGAKHRTSLEGRTTSLTQPLWTWPRTYWTIHFMTFYPTHVLFAFSMSTHVPSVRGLVPALFLFLPFKVRY